MPRVFNASPLHPSFHRRIGSIPVNLERPDPGAIKRVLRVLEAGRVVGIFPEGPFSREGQLVPGQPGVAMIALRSGVPVVPAAIDGTYEALRGRRFYVPRRHPLSVRFGAPIHFGRARHRRVTRAERDERHAAHHGGDRGPPRGRARAHSGGERPSGSLVTRIAPGKAWSGRFAERADPAAEAFTSSLAFDRRLWPYDLEGSAAWARALGRAGAPQRGGGRRPSSRDWQAVKAELESGTFPFRRELEDIHMNVERRLIELAGPVGGKLHTGRSRNDQIALDERLYLRDILGHVDEGIGAVQPALVRRAEEHAECPMPGYTHLQRAQPVLLAHHLLAYVFMLARDRERASATASVAST